MSFLGLTVRNAMLNGGKDIITHIRVPDDDSGFVSDEMAMSWGVSGGNLNQVGSVTFSFTPAPSRTFSKAILLEDDNGTYIERGEIDFAEPLVVVNQAGEATVSSLKVELPE